MADINEDLRRRREALGLTIAQVAAGIGIGRAAVVSNERRPGAAAEMIAAYLARMEHTAAEAARIDRQQALAAVVPSSEGWLALQEAMKDRILDLLDANRCEEADAILEFLPQTVGKQLLDDYFDREVDHG